MKWLLVWIAASVAMLAAQSPQELEKRYWASLEQASARIVEAPKSYQDGRIEPFHSAVEEVLQSVESCDRDLRAMGKNPRKSPKHFKRAELKIRDILRKLKGLEEEIGFEERPAVSKVRTKIQDIHEDLLLDIMGRRR